VTQVGEKIEKKKKDHYHNAKMKTAETMKITAPYKLSQVQGGFFQLLPEKQKIG